MIVRCVEQASTLELSALPARSEPTGALMCPPDHFEVRDVKNPFMAKHVGAVDRAEARRQWEALRLAFESLGVRTFSIDAAPGLEDMTFAANQVLPGLDADGRKCVVLARMRHEARRPEVAHYRRFFEARGYRVLELPEGVVFEGQGDALWHPGRRLLWGGWGFRTDLAAYDTISEKLGVPVLALELTKPEFYHLDTCLCVLDETTALACREAFRPEGWALLERFFPRLLEAPECEALGAMACNAVAIGRTVVLQRGANVVVERLREAGFTPIEVETGEFLKSGGSVFCLKMLFHP